MQAEKLTDNWLFATHSKDTVKEWLAQLRYFYFKRAWGGHANDGDEFQVAFSFTDRQDLAHKIGQLGLPDSEPPGHCIILGHKAFVWANDHSIHITISGTRDGNAYEVTNDDFKVCVELEKHFERLGWQKVADKSLEENVCCISRAKYPELYS